MRLRSPAGFSALATAGLLDMYSTCCVRLIVAPSTNDPWPSVDRSADGELHMLGGEGEVDRSF
jgi:hypothetical protein